MYTVIFTVVVQLHYISIIFEMQDNLVSYVEILDLTSSGIIIFYLVQLQMALLFTLELISFVIGQSYRNLSRRLLNSKPMSRIRLVRFLLRFRRIHNKITNIVMLVNGNFISTPLLLFTVANIPLNVYIISYFYFKPITLVDHLTLGTFVVLQFLMAFLYLAPLLTVNLQQARLRKPFTQLLQLSSTGIGGKLRLLAFCEILSSKKHGFTFGFFSVLTKFKVIKVCLV